MEEDINELTGNGQGQRKIRKTFMANKRGEFRPKVSDYAAKVPEEKAEESELPDLKAEEKKPEKKAE